MSAALGVLLGAGVFLLWWSCWAEETPRPVRSRKTWKAARIRLLRPHPGQDNCSRQFGTRAPSGRVKQWP